MSLPTTIKVRVPITFPAEVTVQSPLVLTITGRNYEFSLDTAALFGAPITVWQLRVALKSAGHFYTVDTAIPVDPGELVYEAWNSGGIRTKTGDLLYTAVKDAIGQPAADAAYAAASGVSL